VALRRAFSTPLQAYLVVLTRLAGGKRVPWRAGRALWVHAVEQRSRARRGVVHLWSFVVDSPGTRGGLVRGSDHAAGGEHDDGCVVVELVGVYDS
jgi:hypothetical protein